MPRRTPLRIEAKLVAPDTADMHACIQSVENKKKEMTKRKVRLHLRFDSGQQLLERRYT